MSLKSPKLSIVTNLAAGMSDESLSHEGTLKFAELAKANVVSLLEAFIQDVA